MQTQHSNSADDHADHMMEAGQFWAKVLLNPQLRRPRVLLHPALLLLLPLALGWLTPFGMDAADISSGRKVCGGLAAFMAIFSLLVATTLANDIARTGNPAPKGYGNAKIEEVTASCLLNVLVAFVLLVCLR